MPGSHAQSLVVASATTKPAEATQDKPATVPAAAPVPAPAPDPTAEYRMPANFRAAPSLENIQHNRDFLSAGRADKPGANTVVTEEQKIDAALRILTKGDVTDGGAGSALKPDHVHTKSDEEKVAQLQTLLKQRGLYQTSDRGKEYTVDGHYGQGTDRGTDVVLANAQHFYDGGRADNLPAGAHAKPVAVAQADAPTTGSSGRKFSLGGTAYAAEPPAATPQGTVPPIRLRIDTGAHQGVKNDIGAVSAIGEVAKGMVLTPLEGLATGAKGLGNLIAEHPLAAAGTVVLGVTSPIWGPPALAAAATVGAAAVAAAPWLGTAAAAVAPYVPTALGGAALLTTGKVASNSISEIKNAKTEEDVRTGYKHLGGAVFTGIASAIPIARAYRAVTGAAAAAEGAAVVAGETATVGSSATATASAAQTGNAAASAAQNYAANMEAWVAAGKPATLMPQTTAPVVSAAASAGSGAESYRAGYDAWVAAGRPQVLMGQATANVSGAAAPAASAAQNYQAGFDAWNAAGRPGMAPETTSLFGKLSGGIGWGFQTARSGISNTVGYVRSGISNVIGTTARKIATPEGGVALGALADESRVSDASKQ